jgi:hypothetical protein
MLSAPCARLASATTMSSRFTVAASTPWIHATSHYQHRATVHQKHRSQTAHVASDLTPSSCAVDDLATYVADSPDRMVSSVSIDDRVCSRWARLQPPRRWASFQHSLAAVGLLYVPTNVSVVEREHHLLTPSLCTDIRYRAPPCRRPIAPTARRSHHRRCSSKCSRRFYRACCSSLAVLCCSVCSHSKRYIMSNCIC